MNIRFAASVLGACAIALVAVTQATSAEGVLDMTMLRFMTVVSGDNQTQPRMGSFIGGTASFSPLTAQVTDGNGKGIPNVQVTWTCNTSGQLVCQMAPDPTIKTITTTTDAQGKTTINQIQGHAVNAYYSVGPFTMTATYGRASAVFHLTVAPGPSIVYFAKIVSGDDQIQPIVPTTRPNGRVFPDANFSPLVVLVTDPTGKPAAGVHLTWACQGAPDACRLAEGPYTDVDTTTDAQGHATLNQVFGNGASYDVSGAFTVTTQATGIPPVTFHLRAINPPSKV
jgi:hypothetical protein